MDNAKYLELFVTESRDHLQRCARDFLAWERAPSDPGHVDSLFRSVHTLKGMAASLGYAPLANLAHALEHVLSAARDGEIGASPDVIDVGLRTIDLLEQGVARAEAGQELGPEADPLIAELSQLARPATGTWPIPMAAPALQAVPPAGDGVEVRVRLRAGTPLAGARAAVVLRQAESSGTSPARRRRPTPGSTSRRSAASPAGSRPRRRTRRSARSCSVPATWTTSPSRGARRRRPDLPAWCAWVSSAWTGW